MTTCFQVARYTAGGWVEDLPILQQNRNWHGCGQYETDSGIKILR